VACSDEEARRQITLGSAEAGLSLRVLAAAGDGPWRDLELACEPKGRGHTTRPTMLPRHR